MCTDHLRHRQTGLTIIELIVFIVIVGTALAGVLTVLNIAMKGSSDPVVRKQGLAIAEALLEEVMLQPFTWCDPDDSNAATATGYASCTTAENNSSPEAGESRTSNITPFDNVNDYNGQQVTTNIAGGGAAPYSANVTVAPAVLNGIGDATTSSSALLITVTVNTGSETLRLQGYRTRYSPNTLP
jgi:MSHA pilin protein MshD